MNLLVIWLINIILLFQETTASQSQNAPTYAMVSIWSVLVFIGGIILNIGGAIVLLKSATVRENLKQQENLAKLYKENYELEKKERESVEFKLKTAVEQRSTFESSYTALAGINIGKLLHFAEMLEEKEYLEKRCKMLSEELLDIRLKGRQ